jgi:hypothetical protein
MADCVKNATAANSTFPSGGWWIEISFRGERPIQEQRLRECTERDAERRAFLRRDDVGT